jgi:hypothetical protein
MLHHLPRHSSLLLSALVFATPIHADFVGYELVSRQEGGFVKFELFGRFNGATDTVLNAFHIALNSGSTNYFHADALNGGVSSNTAGTWNPQFVLVPGAMDSYGCIGGGEGFASGNSTAADPDWGAAGFNTAQIPYGDGTFGPGWFNQNPPNLQGRVNGCGIVKLFQGILASGAKPATVRVKLGYNNGQGGGVAFADSTFVLDPSILAGDCNGNGVLDLCDILSGTANDANENGIPDSCENPGDLNQDGAVDAADVTILLDNWGATGPNIADLNGDGFVGASDFSLLLNNWGATG